VRAWALLLLLLCAAIALPATALSHGKRAHGRFGLKAARVVKRPSLPPEADNDKDGLVNRTELDDSRTNPRKFDTDGDGFGDGAEVTAGSDPLDAASTPAGPPAPRTASVQPTGAGSQGPVEPPPADITPPNTSISSGPSGSTTSTTASFAFSSSEPGSSFECKLDGGSWSACASPRGYNALGLATHTFAVRATDAAGNTDLSPATQSWTVGTAEDKTPPNTSISSGPVSTTTSTSASFGFSSSESGSTFQCTLDAEPTLSCTSPRSYNSLGLGSHAFSVVATDAAGNTDLSAAKRSWTVTEPEVPVDCTTSLSPGADVANAVESAAGGAVICLEAGSYGRISISDAHKSPPVTVRSGSSGRATVNGISLTDPVGLRFMALDITSGTTVTPSGSNLQFIGNDITGVAGIYLFGDYRIDRLISDVLIEGNNIHDLDYVGNQDTGFGYGIEGVGEIRNMIIHDNTIKSPASDYIQSATPINWVVDHNTFLGPSLLGDHEDHQDLWQIFGGGEDITFTNNVARNTETQESLLFQEGAFSNVDIENNLFDHDSRGYTCQLYQSAGMVFRNNTVVGSHWGCLFRDLASSPAGSGYEVDHNVFAETEASVDVSEEGRAGDWGTYDYNVSSDNSAEGVHSVRNWSPSWMDTIGYGPLGLPFAAGYAP
jgi:hypothetical protein